MSTDFTDYQKIKERHTGGNGQDFEDWNEPPADICLSLQQWIERVVPPDDYLLGEFLSTTSRMLLVATTGLGKTNLCLAWAMAIASARDFLHWRAWRPARVLYIDGEMSVGLFKQRIKDAVRRAGVMPEGFFAYCRADFPEMPPLNTEAGQRFIDALIKRIGGVDFVFFDNIQSLLLGDMKEEEPWQQTLPWIRELTNRRIGQIWVHHTGHDESRSYGTKTREWQLDAVAVLERYKESQADIAFTLRFTKARQRTPANRADFATAKIILEGDEWSVETDEPIGNKQPGRIPSPLGRKFHSALLDALAVCGKPNSKTAGRPAVTRAAWESESIRLGLVDIDEPDSKRALISKYRRELIAAEWIACNGDSVWSIK
jgi:AAA domain